MSDMKSKTLAILITGLILIISYAISVAHDLKEGFSIVCFTLLAFILIYGVFASMYELIKITRDEE